MLNMFQPLYYHIIRILIIIITLNQECPLNNQCGIQLPNEMSLIKSLAYHSSDPGVNLLMYSHTLICQMFASLAAFLKSFRILHGGIFQCF